MANSDQDIKQRIAMKAVIVNPDGKILLLREATTYSEGTQGGRYQVPGGRINPGEPFLEGLQREIVEETGLEVSVEKPLYVGEWFPVIRDVTHQIIAVYFICRAKTTEVRVSEEHDDFIWITPKDYVNFDLVAPEDLVIQAYIS